MSTTATSLLRPEALAALADLELVARCAVEGLFQGLHRARRPGFSQEFAEYRAYSEGDDPRFVDWNVYARTGRTYVRRYEGETNTRLVLALDASASMGYASGGLSKLRYAQFLLAALAWLAHGQHDPVGLVVFDATLRSYLPPRRRAGSLPALLQTLDAVQPGQHTDVRAALVPFREHALRRGMVVVASDLYCDAAALLEALRPLAAQGHDLLVLQVLDRRELQPDWTQAVVLRDLETGERREVAPDELARDYPARLQAHLSGLQAAVRSTGALYQQVATDEPLDLALRRYLALRQRKA
ncbi:MAG: hypothetical protein RL026_2797 [Pseudomonadota bacterium]